MGYFEHSDFAIPGSECKKEKLATFAMESRLLCYMNRQKPTKHVMGFYANPADSIVERNLFLLKQRILVGL